ncbi:MBL fold metallo-hydrolase [Candidatus Bathyarchaeota archaeon]|nr:MBL fold metallo-hydrolase [Candidatus Bathyarchaeota archaeon]
MKSKTESFSEEFRGRDIITLDSIKVRLLFFDSLGAKCSSVLVETPDVSILIDPGAAGLQPSFPLPREEKIRLREEAFKRIRHYGTSSDIVVITHYHYDHHVHPSRIGEMACLFRGKTLLVKDPNQWINRSQRSRALKFLSEIYRISGGNEPFEGLMETSRFKMTSDPFERHPKTTSLWRRSKGKKLKVYQAKKRWFEKIVESWKRNKWVRIFEVGGTKILFADGKEFTFGNTRIKFTLPLFHGQFLDNVGWVIGLTVEHAGNKFLFSSDLQGPIIEEYAEWIINSKPEVIVADGPPLYTYGFMIGKEDIKNVIDNMQRIICEARPSKIIWDHHICRGIFKPKMREVYSCAKRKRVNICTAAEHMGLKPLIERVKPP